MFKENDVAKVNVDELTFDDETVNRLITHIHTHYALPDIARRMVTDIVKYVAAQSDDIDCEIDHLCCLLASIGVPRTEIIAVMAKLC